MLKRTAYFLFTLFLANVSFSAFAMETDSPDAAFSTSDPLLHAIEHEPMRAYQMLQQNTQVNLEHIQKTISMFRWSLHAEILSLLLRYACLSSTEIDKLIKATDNNRIKSILLLYSQQENKLQEEFETQENLLEEATKWDVVHVIQNKIDTFTLDEKNKYLCLAAHSQAVAVARLLLEHGAEADCSQSPLSQAFDSSRFVFNPAIIELLLKHGASPVSLEDLSHKTGLLDIKKPQEQEKWKKMTRLMLAYGGNANPVPSFNQNKLFKRRSSYSKQSEKAKLIGYLLNIPFSTPSLIIYILLNNKNEIFCWLLEWLISLGKHEQANTLIQTARSRLSLSSSDFDQLLVQAQNNLITQSLGIKVSTLEELELLIQPMIELAAGQLHEEMVVLLLGSSCATPEALAHRKTVVTTLDSIIKRIEKEKNWDTLKPLEADNLISRYKRIQNILTAFK